MGTDPGAGWRCDSISTMPRILLLTAETLPHDDFETVLVADALAELGIDSDIVAWTSAELSALPADLAVIRTTWDYTQRLPEFLATLGGLSMRLVNDIGVVRWNSHKGYLSELAAAGIPTVPTVVFRSGSKIPGSVELPDFGTAELIVKPAVSAGGMGVGRFDSGSAEAAAHLRSILTSTDALVQPFQPEVLSGERSLIYLGGFYSHAVRKLPTAGDFRVQERFGGILGPHVVSPVELAVAAAALAAAPGEADCLAYARVDLIGTDTAPLVMELELIEPELFLPRAPGSAERFASVIAAQLRQPTHVEGPTRLG